MATHMPEHSARVLIRGILQEASRESGGRGTCMQLLESAGKTRKQVARETGAFSKERA